ncbi:head-tail adaptor protein [Martelella sp. AD-3]|uniref:head-tail adaptor protein n=1 Tax=Martelella sp. AD-3 TaxID=686597 RepID=UPI000467DF4A|nr:head-tail adaptor protein [Martelella sp. AD-3]AMM83148.1 head-tail adaptor protein [Martelella sp. AD-3]
MKAGRLDREIRLERYTETLDEYGAPRFAWTEIDTVAAERIEGSTTAMLKDFGASDETVIVFRLRFLDGLTNADRLIHDGLIFKINQIKEIGRRKGLELRCISTGNGVLA